jgi:7-cyano-7-deazaguanine synthase
MAFANPLRNHTYEQAARTFSNPPREIDLLWFNETKRMEASRNQATILFSGGVDSSALMVFYSTRGFDVTGLFIDYGQAAARYEWDSVSKMARRYQWNTQLVKVQSDCNYGRGELLGRNAFLIFSALFFMKNKTGLIAMGLHAGTSYYDCSESFVELAGRLVSDHTDGRVSLATPFISWTKGEVYEHFASTGLNLHETYSCESGIKTGCGSCLSCLDRKGFHVS